MNRIYDTGANWMFAELHNGIPVAAILVEKGVCTAAHCAELIEPSSSMPPYAARLPLRNMVDILRNGRYAGTVDVNCGKAELVEAGMQFTDDPEFRRFVG